MSDTTQERHWDWNFAANGDEQVRICSIVRDEDGGLRRLEWFGREMSPTEAIIECDRLRDQLTQLRQALVEAQRQIQ